MMHREEKGIPYKAAASVADVARMLGMSRERLYQLIRRGFFPSPLYDLHTRRPCFNEEQQRQCVEARRRNVGIDGSVVLFYSRGPSHAATTVKKPPATTRASTAPVWLMEGVRGLGLATATEAELEAAVKETHPSGIEGVERGTLIRAIFLNVKRKNSNGSVRR